MNPLYTLLARHSETTKIAIREPGGREWSYPEFFDLVARAARVLTDLGVESGDRVALQANKSTEALAVYLGCVQIGAVFLPLNTAYTESEIDYFLEDSAAALFICNPQIESVLATQTKRRVASLDGQGGGSFANLLESASVLLKVTPRNNDDLGAILYTSGTTGRSKGAMLSQQNLASNTETLVDYWQFTASDVLLHALPIYHTHGLFVASNVALATGATMLFHTSFNVDAVVADLPAATTMMGVPTFYTRLLADSRFNHELASHMRLFTSGSAPMLLETHLEFERRTGQRILERYGMTETGMLTSNPYHDERKPGTVGLPLPGVQLRLSTDDSAAGTERESATGSESQTDSDVIARPTAATIGMIEVKGPNVFSGYWQMPEKTAEEFRDDGFFVTGDLGSIDDDGYVTIVGRNKDLIITGGFNVYPKEIELLVDEVEGVRESAVIGLPHADFGEAVTAVVVFENKADKAGVGDTIRQHLETRLAKFKQPKEYVVVDELPRNTMGKVQKNLLRQQYGELFS